MVPYSPRISAGASGLGSNVSCCDGPPDWKMKTTDLRLRGARGCGAAWASRRSRSAEAGAEQAEAADLEQLAAADVRVVFVTAAVAVHERSSVDRWRVGVFYGSAVGSPGKCLTRGERDGVICRDPDV